MRDVRPGRTNRGVVHATALPQVDDSTYDPSQLASTVVIATPASCPMHTGIPGHGEAAQVEHCTPHHRAPTSSHSPPGCGTKRETHRRRTRRSMQNERVDGSGSQTVTVPGDTS